jgi:ABC-type bacteriocin/lantibiotic exporters, contain an N-terminal double-glycine peptidase domain
MEQVKYKEFIDDVLRNTHSDNLYGDHGVFDNFYVPFLSYMEKQILDFSKVSKDLELSGDIKLDNVSFSYTNNSEPVIKNLNLHINQGQKIAIVGSSVSGKSTLSKILLGIYEPTGGDIYYDDINLKELNKQSIRKQIGVVPQDICLFNKSIYENIKMI